MVLTLIESLTSTISYFLNFFFTDLWIVQVWSINYTLLFRYKYIVFIGLYLARAYLKRLIYFFGIPVNCRSSFYKLHDCNVCLNWGKIYVPELLVLSFMESAIPTNWYLLAYFVWSANCSSLICILWILFWTLSDMYSVLK